MTNPSKEALIAAELIGDRCIFGEADAYDSNDAAKIIDAAFQPVREREERLAIALLEVRTVAINGTPCWCKEVHYLIDDHDTFCQLARTALAEYEAAYPTEEEEQGE